jgi:hypothetical protein
MSNAEVGMESENGALGNGGEAHAEKRGRGRPPGVAARDSRPDERELDERGFDERDVYEDREMTDEQRLALFQDSIFQSVLPDLPQIPGFHTCWLSTTNPRDTIPFRKRLGYVLIEASEVPGFGDPGPKTGELAGYVMVNEMVAARLPMRLYQQYMASAHHHAPLDEEEKIRKNVDGIKAEAERYGSVVDEGDGMPGIVQRRSPPRFLQ